jgi:large subunit ribosomal protein L4
MATAVVTDWNKKKVKDVELTDDVFGQEIKKELLNLVVKWQLASRRAGTHKSKTRAEVRGGGKKPFKQKGTGNARQGSTRSPLNPGGADLFGPRPRDYSFTLPRQVKKAALKVALSYLAKNGKLFVVSDMESEGKTTELNSRLKKFGVAKAVLLDASENVSFKRAARNLPNYRYYSVKGLNVYDLLKYDTAIVTESSLGEIVKRCGA